MAKYRGYKMDKTVREFSKCQRKVKHETESEALKAAEKSTAACKREFRVYLCPFCFKWHLTKKENEGHSG